MPAIFMGVFIFMPGISVIASSTPENWLTNFSEKRISIDLMCWTVAFAGFYPGSKPVEVILGCDRSSAHHVRESLKRGLDVCD